jgi:hypothetical protein
VVVIMALSKIPVGVGFPLYKGVEFINKSIEAAEKALNDSNTAKNDASQAISKANQTRTELDQAILNGDSSPLGSQLSVGAESIVYGSPQERLLTEYQKVNNKLNDKAKVILSATEPQEADDDTFWYEDKGESSIDFNDGSGRVSVANATTSNTEPSDAENKDIWFDVQ